MRPHVHHSRPHRVERTHRSAAPRAQLSPVVRARSRLPQRTIPQIALSAPIGAGPDIGPYVDYCRVLTAAGGVLFIYKDLDLRLRHTLWRIFAWTAATGFAGWFIVYGTPLHSDWVKFGCLLLIAVLNWLIVRKPVEVYRRVEIRPDCMVLEGKDVFWLQFMENGLPEFRADEDSNLVLGGPYGTRFVEYLTARKFDENDRMPDVMAAHVQEAMQQLWATAITLGKVKAGSSPPWQSQ
jgi:hypothetical protein